MKNNIFYILLALLFCATSCEKKITLDLAETPEQLVIEGVIQDRMNSSFVKLSKSGGFYDPNVFPALSNATIQITGDNGSAWTLEETEAGIYTHPELVGQYNTTYTLTVEAEGKNYSAVSTMPALVEIDSLKPRDLSDSFFGEEGEYVVECHYTDPGAVDNYYRYKIYSEGELVNELIFNSDNLNNGIVTFRPLFPVVVLSGETVEVELLGVDKAYFDYLIVIDENLSDNPLFSSVPVDPEGNIEGDKVLGHFSAQTVSVKSVTIP